jgi:hypothetical protein
MNLCSYPPPVQEIDLDDYLGLSVYTLNTNFQAIKDGSCFIDTRYQTTQKQISALRTQTTSLQNLSAGLAYAQVLFDCTKNAAGSTNSDNTTRQILHSYNVSSVTKNSNGNYTIDFNGNFGADRYALIGSTSTGIVLPLSAEYNTGSAQINIRNTNNNLTNPGLVSIIIFKN